MVAGRSVEPTGGVDQRLLDAKLSVPYPRPGAIDRGELVQRARTSGRRVVAVTAPAGYGKSTLLAEWARAEDRRLAWVSLDRFDDDPAALLVLLATAYARVAPGSDDLVADMSGLGVSVLGRAAPRLAAALSASPSSFVLMLDDLHELRSAACHDVLEVVIGGVPAGSQLVAASRSEQPHVPRLRAFGEAIEFGTSHLALDSAAAAHIFANSDVSITDELAVALTARTEGWPVGLYLAAVIARDGGGETLAISGDDRDVADYLYRESLMGLAEADQRFLRRSAILDQLCGPLCDVVVGEPGAAAQARLRAFEASSLFLIPLDRRRQWYRYHGLFREFLLAELRRVEPDVIAALHVRAAGWYESNGSPAMAIEHLLHTPERGRCARLVTTMVLSMYQAGQISTVQRWLAALGPAAIAEYPPLAVLAGWMAVFSGETADAQRWAAVADAASFDLVPADGSASFESARAMLRVVMCAAGPERMLADAAFAVGQEQPGSIFRDVALYELGAAHLLVGDTERAASLIMESCALSVALSNTNLVGEFELAVKAMDERRTADATVHVERGLATVDRHRMHDYAVSALTFAAAARLAMHRGDLNEVKRQLTRAMRARPSLTFVLPFLAVRCRVQLANVSRAIGDRSTARHLLQEIDEVLFQRPALGTLVDDVTALRRALETVDTVHEDARPPLTAAELRLLPYLQTHLPMREIAARLFVSRNTVSSQVGAIYRKLGVTSRTDAVDEATTIGLLGG